MIRHRIFETAWGFCGVVAGPRGVLRTFLPQSSHRGLERSIRREPGDSEEDAGLLSDLVAEVQAYFRGEPAWFEVELDLGGISSFRRRVLEACRSIPRGQTASYAELARQAGSPRATRAAGSAMAHNPCPLVIPCHRVVRSDGSLGGFSSTRGVRQKQRLLMLEGAL